MLVRIWEIGKEMVWAIVLMLFFTNQYAINAQTIPNGDFEDWKANRANILEPVGWETQNDAQLLYVERAEGHSGDYAIGLNVIWDKMVQSFSGAGITSGKNIKIDGDCRMLSGFYKGNTDNNDTLEIDINFYSDSKIIAYGSLSILNADKGWEQFSVPVKFLSNAKPETASISISIILAEGSHNLTKYFIDDLKFSE
jgi:hypothetical protein